MKILIHGINFAPELTGVGKYTGEMAEWLASRGHDVRVVTAPPYYPGWSISTGYRAARYTKERLGGCLVWRCPVWVPSCPNGTKRVLHLTSFAVASLPILLRQVLWRPDVVWVVQPAFLCVPGAWLTAKLSGARTWLHIQDYELDAAFELGLLRGRGLRRLTVSFERWMMRRFHRVSTISLRMMERGREKGVVGYRLDLLPNWFDPCLNWDVEGANAIRVQLGIESDEVVALYSGTMGRKQGLELLADAASRLRNENLRFVFCGNGPGRASLEARCGDFGHVTFLDLQPPERLGALLAMADIHLLPQQAQAADLVMPSKLTGMLASGRPVVATCAEGTELADVLRGHGLAVAPEDIDSFVEAISTLMHSPELRSRLGVNARRYAEQKLSRDPILTHFEAALRRLIEEDQRHRPARYD
jgi:colanic acid biosynthesis glycosyl transferase WcaI